MRIIAVLSLAALCGHAQLGQQREAGRTSSNWTATGSFFALSVADAGVVSLWYRDRLGFEIVREEAASASKIRIVLLKRGDNLIEIVQRESASTPGPMPDRSYERGIFKVGFRIEDLEGLAQELKRKDTIFLHGIVVPAGAHYRTFAIKDPEGNIVQFFGR